MDDQGERHILVVCSDPLMRRLATDGLVEQGMYVTEAASVYDGHNVLSGPYIVNLVIVDLDLGDRSGISFAQHARSVYPEIPVLFLTASEDPLEDLEAQISQEGFDRPFGVMRIRLDGPNLEQHHTGTVDGRGHI